MYSASNLGNLRRLLLINTPNLVLADDIPRDVTYRYYPAAQGSKRVWATWGPGCSYCYRRTECVVYFAEGQPIECVNCLRRGQPCDVKFDAYICSKEPMLRLYPEKQLEEDPVGAGNQSSPVATLFAPAALQQAVQNFWKPAPVHDDSLQLTLKEESSDMDELDPSTSSVTAAEVGTNSVSASPATPATSLGATPAPDATPVKLKKRDVRVSAKDIRRLLAKVREKIDSLGENSDSPDFVNRMTTSIKRDIDACDDLCRQGKKKLRHA